jgi:hypothetical protein
VADVTPVEAHWSPPGKAHPLGANYAHVVIGEDGVVNGMLKGEAPLFAATWAGKTGVSELPPWLIQMRRVSLTGVSGADG